MVSIFPIWGYPHISETTYVEKERKRGQVCVEPHIFRKVPYRVLGKKCAKKHLGATPSVFAYFVEFCLPFGKGEEVGLWALTK